MSQDKSSALAASGDAANEKFSTDNIIPGGCSECGCKTLIDYKYESGRPVPNAPFVVKDSKGTIIKGKTDDAGLALIQDMGCGGYEIYFEEGSDTFTPEPTVENNPLLQSNPAYAALAGEYFSLFTLLHEKGIVVYDADDSDDYEVDLDDSSLWDSLFSSLDDKEQQAYDRLWELNRQINAGSKELKQAINTIHQSSLAAETADGGSKIVVMLVCEVILGCVPVIGQAMDVYFLGDWLWRGCENTDRFEDWVFLAEGALAVIGFIPGLGDVIKRGGKAILSVCKANTPQAVQKAIQHIRHISDGNIVRWLLEIIDVIKNKCDEAIALLERIELSLKLALKMAFEKGKGNWIIAWTEDAFSGVIETIRRFIQRFRSAVDDIIREIKIFIGKVVKKDSGTALGKNDKDVSEKFIADKTPPESDYPDKSKKKAESQEQDNNLCTSESVCKNDPVDVATGFAVDWRTDVIFSGVFPVFFKRYYRSGGTRQSGLLGKLWRTNWDMNLTLSQGVVHLLDGEYGEAIFNSPDEGEVSLSLSNPQWRLTRENGKLIVVHQNGLRYYFEHSCGKQLFLTAITDKQNNGVSLLWERGVLRWVVLPDERLIHVATQYHRITSLTLCTPARRPIKTLVSYIYDKHGYVIQVRGSEGRNFDYDYSPEGWLLRWSDLAHTWGEHDYDSKGRVTYCRGAEGYWQGHFEYDDDTLTSHYHSGFGGVFSYVRDARNNILLKRTPDGGETRLEWVDNQLVAETDPLGGRTVYQRNDWGQVTSVTLPDGATHHYAYDDNGQLLAYTDPLGSEWRYQRNAAGQVIEVNDPEGREWLYRYEETGLLSTVIAPDGVLQRYHYNRRGLLNRLERDNAPAVMFRYDDLDRLTERHIAHEAGVQVRRWEYDGVRESPSKVVYEDGSETRFGYDVEGNLTAVTDALGQRYQFRYGAFDNLLEATDPLGATVRYHYNAEAAFAGVTN
ncbi:DUF6531 domain-containing protein, partial [Pectobacterium fontis]